MLPFTTQSSLHVGPHPVDNPVVLAPMSGVTDIVLRRLAVLHPLRYIAGHSDVSPGRKTDPGPFFRWDQLAPVLATIGVSRPF